MEDGGRPGRPGVYLHAGVLGLVAVLTFLRTRHIGLLGFDSYPIILTSRIRNWSDFVGTFTESLMDGRYAGDFYRPLVNLTCALDHALWGLDARGFQWTNALLFAGCVAAVHYLARRLAPDGPHWLVPFVFLLHPASADVTPFIARRAETLCCAFLALSAAAVVVGPGLQRDPRGRRGLAAAAFTILAIGAKETGYLAPMLVAVTAWVGAASLAPRARVVSAIRWAAPSGVAAFGMLAVRWRVLGGLGGHETSGVAVAPERIVEVVAVIGQRLAAPDLGPPSWWLIGVVAAVFAVAAWRSRREPTDVGLGMSGRGMSGLVIVGVAWLGLACLTYAGAGRVPAWYLLIPAAAWALIVVGVGGWLGALVHVRPRLSGRPRFPRALGAIGLLALALMVGAASQHAPLLRDDPRWAEGTAASERFLVPLLASLESSSPGDVIEPGAPPRRVGGNQTALRRAGVWVLTDYSIQAWSELVMPERDPRVVVKGPELQPATDEVLIALPAKRARKSKGSGR